MVCAGWKGGGLLSTHYPCCGAHLSGVCVVMTVCDDSACLVLSRCVVGCGMAGGVACLPFLFVFLFSSLLLVFGVVRAQLREHARYPRTPLRLFCCVLFSLLLVFLHAPPFCVWNGGGGLPCVGVLCWHDCDG